MRTIACTILALAACVTDEVVPERPTYQVDVAPILNARCIRCHGSPTLAVNRPDFRLDRYDGLGQLAGAFETRTAIAQRVRGLGGGENGMEPLAAMPPRFPLTDTQIETLVRWNDQGAERGPPRPGNQPPELRIGIANSGRVLEVAYELADPDDDVVTGAIFARYEIAGQEITELLLELSSGREDGRNITLPMRPAIVRYTIFARIDDGAGELEQPITELTL